MSIPLTVFPDFPLAKCRTCGGHGELATSHTFDCYDCDGVGYLWHGQKIPREHVPDKHMRILIVPCCAYARDALWKNAKVKMDEYYMLVERTREGTRAHNEINKMLTFFAPTTSTPS